MLNYIIIGCFVIISLQLFLILIYGILFVYYIWFDKKECEIPEDDLELISVKGIKNGF